MVELLRIVSPSAPRIVVKSDEQRFVLAEICYKKITPKDICWIAGFLEGEGCFYWSAGVLHITASQVQGSVLGKLKGLVGGNVYLRGIKPYRKNPIYVWKICGRAAVGLALTLFDLMSEKRKDQIKKGIGVWRESIMVMDRNRAKKHCPAGHSYSKENTIVIKTKEGWVQRTCKTCLRLKQRRYRSLDYWKNW